MPTSFAVRMAVARQDIEATFADRTSKVLSLGELTAILNTHRESWRLGGITTPKFIDLLVERFRLRKINLDFATRPIVRYAWGAVRPFELIQSINAGGYFSHYTAVQFHQLTLQTPTTVYFNVEQKVRPGGGNLTQQGINNTFTRAKCRVSSNIARFNELSICQIGGGNTDNLGVIEAIEPNGTALIRITNLERTLIDAAVRPVYSGGVLEVKNAFAAARDLVSVNKLVAYLKTIGYTYPIHQSIGFYMERTGYRESQLDLLRQFPREFDFYLDYGTKEPEFNSHWRLFHPQGL